MDLEMSGPKGYTLFLRTHHVLLSCRSLYSSISWDTNVSCSVHSPSFECAAASRNPESLLLLPFVVVFNLCFVFWVFFLLLICCSTRCSRALSAARHSPPLVLSFIYVCRLFFLLFYSIFTNLTMCVNLIYLIWCCCFWCCCCRCQFRKIQAAATNAPQGGNTFVREFFSGNIKNTTQATHSTSHLFPVETNYRPTWLS